MDFVQVCDPVSSDAVNLQAFYVTQLPCLWLFSHLVFLV